MAGADETVTVTCVLRDLDAWVVSTAWVVCTLCVVCGNVGVLAVTLGSPLNLLGVIVIAVLVVRELVTTEGWVVGMRSKRTDNVCIL